MSDAKYKMVVGKSGSGKTSGILIPEIKKTIKKGTSFLVTDAGNDVLEYVGKELQEQDYNIVVLNLREKNQSDRWNPLMMPYEEFQKGNYDRAYSLLNDIANSIFYTRTEKKEDPFWDISSRDLFTGLCFGLFEDAKNVEEINLMSIYNMELVGNKKMAGGISFLNQYYESKKDKFGYISSGLRGTVIAPTDTKSSILAVFNQKLRQVSMNDKYISILCDSTFDMKSCLNQKTAFVLQFEDEKEAGAGIVHIFIKQIYEMLVKRDGLKNDRAFQDFYMFFEDFLCLDYVPYIDKMLMGAKKRNISMFFSINSFSLLKKMYGEYTGNALMENCDEVFLVDLGDIELLKYLKELKECGQISDDIFEKKLSIYEYITIRRNKVIERASMNESVKRNGIENWGNKGQKEIQYFDFESYVIKQRENLQGEKGLKPFEVDDLIAKIDKKIQELEQEEKRKNA